MAIVTYLIRAIPLVLVKHKIKNKLNTQRQQTNVKKTYDKKLYKPQTTKLNN